MIMKLDRIYNEDCLGREDIKISRIWAMPNKWTFTIKPIKELLNKYVDGGQNWLDPMAGRNSPAEITNDLDLESPSKYHKDALEFLKEQKDNSIKGVIFDPPFSYEKAKRLYKQKYPDTQVFFNYIRSCKRELCRIIKVGGYVILCGWNSNGLGKKNGFKLLEILFVPHGWNKGDTIVTVEQRLEEKNTL